MKLSTRSGGYIPRVDSITVVGMTIESGGTNWCWRGDVRRCYLPNMAYVKMDTERDSVTANAKFLGLLPWKNVTFLTTSPKTFNTSQLLKAPRIAEPFSLFQMSYFWSSFFGIFATIAIGLLVSALTGEMWSKQEQPKLCSDALVKLWRKPAHRRVESQNEETKTSKLEEHKSSAELENLVNASSRDLRVD
ncbi:hypothetical protein MTO96_033455 [Rhipicephalus appendiculatus]